MRQVYRWFIKILLFIYSFLSIKTWLDLYSCDLIIWIKCISTWYGTTQINTRWTPRWETDREINRIRIKHKVGSQQKWNKKPPKDQLDEGVHYLITPLMSPETNVEIHGLAEAYSKRLLVGGERQVTDDSIYLRIRMTS